MLLSVVLAAGAPAGATEPASVEALPLESGDVVLRQGPGFWSVVFAGLNRRDRRFSHAGIVVGSGGHWQVVHAEADDDATAGIVRLDSWETFTAGASRLAVLRLEDSAVRPGVAAAALDMHAAALPFDFDFDLNGAAAVYCSELVWRALVAALKRDLLPDKPVVHGREAVLIESFLHDMPGLRLVGLSGEDPPGEEARRATTGAAADRR